MFQEKYDENYFNQPLFFTLCDSMREGAAILDASTKRFIYCNQAFFDLFGFQSKAQLNINVFRTLRKEWPSKERRVKIEALLSTKGVYYELVEYHTINGEPFFAELTIRPYHNKGVDYYLLNFSPVDRSFFEISSVGILMINEQGEITTINTYALNLFGYAKNDIVGKKVEVLIPKRFQVRHSEIREDYTRRLSHQPISLGKDLTAVKEDGTEFPVEVSLGNYHTCGHDYVIVFVHDISARIENEKKIKALNEALEFKVDQRTAELRKTLKQLKRSKVEREKYILFQHALLNNAAVMIISSDNKGNIQTFNREAERELGYEANELLVGNKISSGQREQTKVATNRRGLSGRNTVVPKGLELLFTCRNSRSKNEREWQCIRKNGTKFPVQLSMTGMENRKGEITGYVVAAVNISELKKREADLILAYDKERELNELKSRFVSMASHEFRTPLSTVLSSSYLVEKYQTKRDQPKRAMHLQRIASAVTQLSGILDDFLSVGRIEEGKLRVKVSNVNIRELVTSIIAETKSNLKKHQVINYRHYGKATGSIDPSLFKHILFNLISNASKFSNEKCTIDIATQCLDGQLKLIVKDEGIGIPAADQPHVAERFFRAANATNIQGTGLGLNLVSKYAELMNGSLRFNSTEGEGAEFIVKCSIK